MIATRSAKPDDEPFLFRVFASARERDFAFLPTEIVEMQFRAQRASYSAQFPGCEFLVILLDEIPVGLLSVAESSQLHMLDIAVLPDYRGKGIATQVIDDLIGHASAVGKRLLLTVRLENLARGLYERLGFEEISRDEVNVVMEWTPGENGGMAGG